MSTTLGAFVWSTTRGIPSAGQVTLASDPFAAVANTLRVSVTDDDGNNRDAVIDLVATGDVIRITDDFAVVVGLPVDNVTYWSFPFTVSTSFVASDEPDDAEAVTLQSRVPAAWPTTEELAQVLNVDNVTDWETTLDRVMGAAINKVRSDAGLWAAASNLPTDNQAQAALRMAELISTRPDTPDANARDKTYVRLLTGQRRRFGIG
jgi:hypothetical protein